MLANNGVMLFKIDYFFKIASGIILLISTSCLSRNFSNSSSSKYLAPKHAKKDRFWSTKAFFNFECISSPFWTIKYWIKFSE